MVGHDGIEEADRYGSKAWWFGLAIAVIVIVLMFVLARGY